VRPCFNNRSLRVNDWCPRLSICRCGQNIALRELRIKREDQSVGIFGEASYPRFVQIKHLSLSVCMIILFCHQLLRFLLTIPGSLQSCYCTNTLLLSKRRAAGPCLRRFYHLRCAESRYGHEIDDVTQLAGYRTLSASDKQILQRAFGQ
jgi:hypothetical protein